MLSLSPGWRGQPYIARGTVKDLGSAQYLAAHASPGDPIVVMGYRRSVTAYYLDRVRRPYTLRSFPAELAEHPGWFSASRLLRDRERLAQEGEALARELVTAARQGRTVWVLTSPFSEVDDYLHRPLRRLMVVDGQCSRRDLSIVCLRP